MTGSRFSRQSRSEHESSKVMPAAIMGGDEKGEAQSSDPIEKVTDTDWDEFLRSNNHSNIRSKLRSVSLGDRISLKRKGKNPTSHTVFYSVLKNTTNGDQILLDVLDECVSATMEDENDPKYAVQIDLSPILAGGEDANQIDVVKDMLEFKNTPAKEVLKHPVMETFLDLKWRKIKNLVMINFAIYFIFLLSYSLFLGNMFYRQDRNRSVKLSDLTVQNNRIVFPSDFQEVATDSDEEPFVKRSFLQCLTSNNEHFDWTCVVEVIMAVSIFLLLAQEILQCYALGGRQYFRELENSLELAVLILASIGLGVQSDMGALKWVSAFGITLGYLQLIFLMGRYPFLGGSISLMFYSIIRRLARSLSNFLVLVVGYSFGFFIMFQDKEDHYFQNPLKAFVRTLTMVFGEFEFTQMYDAHSEDKYSLMFTMVLLVSLAVMGSLVLINLIVALIVSDIHELQEQARLQELVNKAQHVVHIDSLLDYVFRCCSQIRGRLRISNQVRICAHNLCNCDARKIRSQIAKDLKLIVHKRSILKEIEDLTTGSTEERYVEDMTNAMMRLGRQNKQRLAQSSTNVFTALAEILIDGSMERCK
ncbi:hypothetical protein TCAL_06511 [Tigriopus californicus]|uniref:Ion transport domain-containing protein n=1 Tax=Tigriopus californicus TaxID=6832 RepID=A0A553P4G5_TIGCA|nr:transient receptor potential cation channel protein painless-like isoform X2 [Tigriopus californicus]TRY72563.1 hypothetical protein TCAL_06511 [Tigriopus californicus]